MIESLIGVGLALTAVLLGWRYQQRLPPDLAGWFRVGGVATLVGIAAMSAWYLTVPVDKASPQPYPNDAQRYFAAAERLWDITRTAPSTAWDILGVDAWTPTTRTQALRADGQHDQLLGFLVQGKAANRFLVVLTALLAPLTGFSQVGMAVWLGCLGFWARWRLFRAICSRLSRPDPLVAAALLLTPTAVLWSSVLNKEVWLWVGTAAVLLPFLRQRWGLRAVVGAAYGAILLLALKLPWALALLSGGMLWGLLWGLNRIPLSKTARLGLGIGLAVGVIGLSWALLEATGFSRAYLIGMLQVYQTEGQALFEGTQAVAYWSMPPWPAGKATDWLLYIGNTGVTAFLRPFPSLEHPAYLAMTFERWLWLALFGWLLVRKRPGLRVLWQHPMGWVFLVPGLGFTLFATAATPFYGSLWRYVSVSYPFVLVALAYWRQSALPLNEKAPPPAETSR